MGGQQVWEWAVRYPDMAERIAPVAITAKNSPHAFIFAETLNEALKSDPKWSGGNYKKSSDVRVGLFRQARLWAVMGLNPEFYKRKYWRNMNFTSAEDFVSGFLEAYYEPLDPNNLLCMAQKWQRGDVSRNTGGSLRQALERIKAKTLVMGFTGDMFVPRSDLEYEQKMIAGCELRMIDTICGHFALFALEPGYMPQVDKNLEDLLSSSV
jgi:homoserine O-acetyltransferase